MKHIYDYLIIGAGPAGLQLGYFLQQNGRDYLILERGASPGQFFKQFPRHKKLISINKVYTGVEDNKVNLRWDWNSLLSNDMDLKFTDYSKQYFPSSRDLVKYLRDYAKHFELNVRYKSDVEKISKVDDVFSVQVAGGKIFTARRLIVATGVSKPFMPDIPGIEKTERYYDYPSDPERYINKRVLIIGKGNSGFEVADSLLETAAVIHMASPTPIKFAWRSHFVGHVRALNANFLDTYQLKMQNGMINANIAKIECRNKKYKVSFNYKLANGECETIEYDHVITATGFRLDTSIFAKNCMPELAINNRFPSLTSWFESANIRDLFFIGTLMQQRDFKKESSGFIHGFRFNVAFLANLFEQRYHNSSILAKRVKPDAKSLTRALIKRVNETAALWQQPSFLGDVLVYDDDKNTFEFYETMPVDYIHESPMVRGKHYVVLTLEFGQERIDASPNIFALERVHKQDHQNAHLSTFIHPILRHYHDDTLLSEHHIIEDFESEWREQEHVEPLHNYIEKALAIITIMNPSVTN